MVIYKITNKINGKAYIGQTIQEAEKRWKFHKSARPSKSLISQAIKDFGLENFTFEVIERVNNIKELNEKEAKLIRESACNGRLKSHKGMKWEFVNG